MLAALEESIGEECQFVPDVRCPHCSGFMKFPVPEYEFWEAVEVCEHCGRRSRVRIGGFVIVPSIIVGQPERYEEFTKPRRHPLTGKELLGGRLLSIESAAPVETVRGLNSPPIPPEPYEAVQEAIKSLETGAYRAAASMCRYTIQSALLDRGAPDQRPMDMINYAKQQGLVSDIVISRCRAIVYIGNSGAHPQADVLRNIGRQDAVEGLRLTRRVLLELYDPQSITSDD